MSIEIESINVGLVPNDRRGDDLRAASLKTNRNAQRIAAALDAAQVGTVAATAAAAAAVAAAAGGAKQTDLLAALSGPVPAGFPARRGQFLAALEASGAGRIALCAANVPPDPGDPINRAWFHTTFVTSGCALFGFVASTLAGAGVTADVNAILVAARSITE